MNRTEYFINLAKDGTIISDETEFKELSDLLLENDVLYNEGTPLLLDKDYDLLYFLARNSEEVYPNFKADSTNKIKSETLFNPIEHQFKILSLDKVNDIDGVIKFLDKLDFENKDSLYYTDGVIIQYKVDGLTNSLYSNFDKVNNGALTMSTRGDGEFGDDITSNVINTIPNESIKALKDIKLAARGEAIINDSKFDEINTDGKYMNSRNLVAGSIRTKDENTALNRGVHTLFYNIENASELGLETEIDQLKYLESIFGKNSITYPLNKLGKESKDFTECIHNKEDAIKIIKEFSDTKRLSIGYAIDGLVIKPNNIKKRDEIGFTSHHPKNTMAFKFESPDGVTYLREVKWQIGSTGRLTPVAFFDPVEILGANVARATLHNPFILKELGLKIGDKIVVKRSNDVIPAIVKSFKELRDGSEVDVQMPTDYYVDGKNIYTNTVTKEQLIESWDRFASKKYMNISGLSTKTIITLSDSNVIDLGDFSSLYKMEKDSFINLDGLGEKSWDSLQTELTNSKSIGLERVIASMNIKFVGRTLAKLITKHITKWQDLVDIKSNNELEEWLTNLELVEDGIGPSKIKAIREGLLDNNVLIQMKALESVGVSLDAKNKVVANTTSVSGIKFVVTGKTNIKRDDLKVLIEDAGGKLSGSISKSTDYLVSNAESSHSKSRKAEELGIKVITEDQLLKMIK